MNLEIKGVVLIQCLFYNYQKALLDKYDKDDSSDSFLESEYIDGVIIFAVICIFFAFIASFFSDPSIYKLVIGLRPEHIRNIMPRQINMK